jgi:hypothetical protein
VGQDRDDALGVEVVNEVMEDFRDHPGNYQYSSFAKSPPTNCLGFVCFAYSLLDAPVDPIELLDLDWFSDRQYRSPYKGRSSERDFPSPGHLAQALDCLPTRDAFPYTPKCPADVTLRARALVTLARKQGLRPPPSFPV